MKDTEPVAEAREALDGAVRAFVAAIATQRGETEPPIVVAWAGYAEYTSVEHHQAEISANVILVPSDQDASTSRGCFEFGADAFRR